VETADVHGVARCYEVRSARVVDDKESIVGIVTTVRQTRPKAVQA
jgi:hypothetical protein